jgi:hypothetical protein
MIKTDYYVHIIQYYPPSTKAHIIELQQIDIGEEQLLTISKDNNVAVISYGINYYHQGKRLGTLAKARNILNGR